MNLEPALLDDLAALRRAKLDELRVRTFSWRHEERVAAARALRIREGHAEPGYALFLESEPEAGAGDGGAPRLERCVLEFAVDVPWRGRALEYLQAAIETLGASQVWVRTDDGAACEAALAMASRDRWDVQPAGPLYALETGVLRRPARPEHAEVRRVGAKEEAADVLALFTATVDLAPGLRDGSALEKAKKEERLWSLTLEGRLAGAALVLAHPHHRYAGIRPVLLPDFRRKGLATYLIGEVSHALLLANHRLIAEAGPLERAPRRIAEKLGLTLAAHRLWIRKL
jgi:hypothetical protein